MGLAFFAIYFVWGTTYLAIRYAVETPARRPATAERMISYSSATHRRAWAIRRASMHSRISTISRSPRLAVVHYTTEDKLVFLAVLVDGSGPLTFVLDSGAPHGAEPPPERSGPGALTRR